MEECDVSMVATKEGAIDTGQKFQILVSERKKFCLERRMRELRVHILNVVA